MLDLRSGKYNWVCVWVIPSTDVFIVTDEPTWWENETADLILISFTYTDAYINDFN